MAAQSDIEWTEATWNPVTGCTKISPGCAHCYAERMARRLQAMGQANYANGFALTLQNHLLRQPLKWRKPRLIFVNSMSDLFHKAVPCSFIKKVFKVMGEADWHVFQILTKRSERLVSLAASLPWPQNVWMGVTVENERFAFRIDHLRQVPAAVRFVSFEPLLGPLPRLDLTEIDWAIVGGESGPNARPMVPRWVIDIRNQCRAADVAFFFKQWGGPKRKDAGRLLEGKLYSEMPCSPLRQKARLVSA